MSFILKFFRPFLSLEFGTQTIHCFLIVYNLRLRVYNFIKENRFQGPFKKQMIMIMNRLMIWCHPAAYAAITRRGTLRGSGALSRAWLGISQWHTGEAREKPLRPRICIAENLYFKSTRITRAHLTAIRPHSLAAQKPRESTCYAGFRASYQTRACNNMTNGHFTWRLPAETFLPADIMCNVWRRSL